MRRALSSDNGFLGFLDLGLGFVGFPSLRDHGSGCTEKEREEEEEEESLMGALWVVEGSLGRVGKGRSWSVLETKVELRESISSFTLTVCSEASSEFPWRIIESRQ